MTIAPLVDVTGALVARLRTFSEILAFVTTASGYTPDATTAQKARARISAEVQSFWKLPYPAVLVVGPVGSPGDDREAGIETVRLDLHCYGTNAYEAMRLWRQVHPCLCPPSHQRIAESFIGSGVRVFTVDREGGPTRLVEPDTHYPKVVATYVIRFAELAAP